MIRIQADFPLQAYNTFGIEAITSFYTEVSSIDQIRELMATDVFNKYPHFILGGGSNILFKQDFPGLTIHPLINGTEITDEDTSHVYLKAGGGMAWDELVQYAVENNWGGIENLSGIPGTVGASPIQNIGAYGVEVKDVIVAVEGVNLENGKTIIFDNTSCKFGYRTSVFKEKLKNRFLVCNVTFRLTKTHHALITKYGTIEKELEKYTKRDIATIRKVVCEIRNAKLPDPALLGNAGSFFKNPVVSEDKGKELKKKYPEIPQYPSDKGCVKLSAAWLIEQSGCKGIQLNRAASHTLQPLVLVNLGGASGREILGLAAYIEQRVREVFGINLEKEVNII